MDLRASLRLASFLSLILLVVIGILLVLRATPDGLSLSDDSLAYVAGARGILGGQRYRDAWLAATQPGSHFPPACSSVLGCRGMFGIDPLRGARLVNS